MNKQLHGLNNELKPVDTTQRQAYGSIVIAGHGVSIKKSADADDKQRVKTR